MQGLGASSCVARNAPASAEPHATLKIPNNIDAVNYMFRENLTDGLPCVPPTLPRLAWMLAGTDLAPDTVLGRMPPIMASCTVSNVAVAAVMAGCEPKHLRIVIAAVEAMLDAEFNIHGCHATTMGCTPALIINGARVTKEAGLNCLHGACGSSGQSCRANACIGRAVKLCLQNCGRSMLGGTESTTIGGPRKFSLTLCENFKALEKGPWAPFRGNGADCVTVHAISSGVDQLVDKNVDRDLFIRLMARKIANLWIPGVPVRLLECVIVISPEHYKMLHESGVASKGQLAHMLFNASNEICSANLPLSARVVSINKLSTAKIVVAEAAAYFLSALSWIASTISPDSRSWLNTVSWTAIALMYVGGLVTRRGYSKKKSLLFVLIALALERIGALKRLSRRMSTLAGTKMLSPSSIHIVVAGSEAGKFSCVMPGFGAGASEAMKKLSTCVTKPIPPEPQYMSENIKLLSPALVDSSQERLICNPRGQCEMPRIPQAPRSSISVLGLLDISKPGGSMYFDRLAELMKSKGVRRIRHYRKPTFSRQCPMILRRRIVSECDAVVLSLAD